MSKKDRIKELEEITEEFYAVAKEYKPNKIYTILGKDLILIYNSLAKLSEKIKKMNENL